MGGGPFLAEPSMSESTKLFPDGSVVQLLVGVEARDGREIEAGATGNDRMRRLLAEARILTAG
jgi:hypothetical protein